MRGFLSAAGASLFLCGLFFFTATPKPVVHAGADENVVEEILMQLSELRAANAKQDTVIAEQAQAEAEPPAATCLFFTLDNCPPCDVLKSRIAAELVPLGWTFGPLGSDIELINDQGIADSYGVTNYPTLIVCVGGKEVSRTVGAGVSAGALSAWVNKYRTAQ
jgi:hypothetical protein